MSRRILTLLLPLLGSVAPLWAATAAPMCLPSGPASRASRIHVTPARRKISTEPSPPGQPTANQPSPIATPPAPNERDSSASGSGMSTRGSLGSQTGGSGSPGTAVARWRSVPHWMSRHSRPKPGLPTMVGAAVPDQLRESTHDASEGGVPWYSMVHVPAESETIGALSTGSAEESAPRIVLTVVLELPRMAFVDPRVPPPVVVTWANRDVAESNRRRV